MRNARTKRLTTKLAVLIPSAALLLALVPARAAPAPAALGTVGYLQVVTTSFTAPGAPFCLAGTFYGTLVFAGKTYVGTASMGGLGPVDDCTGVRIYPDGATSPVWNFIAVDLRGEGLSGICHVGWGALRTKMTIDCWASVGNGATGGRRMVTTGIGRGCGSGCQGYLTAETIYRGVA